MAVARPRNYESKTLIYTNQQEHVNIYKAEMSPGCFCCIKEQCFLTPEDRDASRERNQLQKELNHPNVCEIYNIESWDGSDGYYLSLEIEWAGADLEQITLKKSKEKQSWSPQECVIILYSVIDALSSAERKGVCHRDIKPSNLFLTSDNTYKVGDFGCAKYTEKGYLQHTMAGTPLFLSPALRKAYTRQLLGQDVQQVAYDPFKSDVYSLGLSVLYLLKPTVLPLLGNYTELLKVLNSLSVCTELKTMLSEMLIQEEEARPGFQDLELKLPDLIRATLLSELNRSVIGAGEDEIMLVLDALFRCNSLVLRCDVKDGREPIPRKKKFILMKRQPKAEEEKVVSTEPRVQPQSPVPAPVTDCPKIDGPEHLSCCVKCQRALPAAMQEWQLKSFGSQKFEQVIQCCSESCFQSQYGGGEAQLTDSERTELQPFVSQTRAHFSENPSRKEMSVIVVVRTSKRNREDPNTIHFYHCQRHTYTKESFVECSAVDKPTTLHQCPECEYMGCYPFELENIGLPLIKNFECEDLAFCKLMISPRYQAYMQISQVVVEELARGQCHFCGGNLIPKKWRYLLHNSLPAVICSSTCASTALATNSTCPMCRVELSPEAIEVCCDASISSVHSLLRVDESYCFRCMFRDSEFWLPCGHGFCAVCMTLAKKVEEQPLFPCLTCGRAYKKAEYSDLFPNFA